MKDQYVILDDYSKQLTTTNSGTTTLLKTTLVDNKRVFERVYICLKACKDGFNKGCRPLICLMGVFSKDIVRVCYSLLWVSFRITLSSQLHFLS